MLICIIVDPCPDDLSVLLEPPTGRMVEPEEEVGASVLACE